MYAYQRVFEAPQLWCDYLIEMLFDSGLIDYKFVSSLQWDVWFWFNRELGLLVQGVEEGGRVFKDGRLRENDRIIEINGQTLMGVTFSK